jgi:hypothetical protein
MRSEVIKLCCRHERRRSCTEHVAYSPLWKYDVNNQPEDIATDGSSGLARFSVAWRK